MMDFIIRLIELALGLAGGGLIGVVLLFGVCFASVLICRGG